MSEISISAFMDLAASRTGHFGMELPTNAEVIAVGSLLQLGTVGANYFAERKIPVKAVLQQPFEMWTPGCPHCAAGAPLESLVAPAA